MSAIDDASVINVNISDHCSFLLSISFNLDEYQPTWASKVKNVWQKCTEM